MSALNQAKLAGWTAYQVCKLDTSSDNACESTWDKHKVREKDGLLAGLASG